MGTNVAIDAIIGGLFMGIFSHLTNSNSDSVNYIKMVGFVYAAPVGFVFLLYILSRGSKTYMTDFTVHALIGTISTMFLLLSSLLIRTRDKKTIMLWNLVSLITIITSYFYFRVYEII